jgi:hypothetical protein
LVVTNPAIFEGVRSYKQFKIFSINLGVVRFNATSNNISVISWRPVLLVEETGGL